MPGHRSWSLVLPRQPYFRRLSFLKHLNFTVMNENKFKKFVSLTFTVLDHLSVLLLFFITFWAILMAFKGFGKSKKSKMADPRWLPLFEIMT